MKTLKKYFLLFFLLVTVNITVFSQITQDFEDNNLGLWIQSTSNYWGITSTDAISGSLSLKHIFDNSESSHDQIALPLAANYLNGGESTWRFQIKYGYSPSGSNNWAVFLISDKNAQEMHQGGTASGYVLGVNFSGTDDILKLWKKTGESEEIIFNSEIDWEDLSSGTETNGFEITRTKNGEWTIKTDTIGGGFDDLKNIGTITDNEHISAKYFGFYYEYSSTKDQLFWADDISITLPEGNNEDSEVEILTDNTPTNLSSIADIDSEGVRIFDFNLKDNASGDSKPTILQNIQIAQGDANDITDWTNLIEKARLYSQTLPDTGISGIISATKLEFSCDTSLWRIADGSADECYIKIWLKKELSGISENDHLELKLDYQNITALPSGSTFGAGSGESGDDKLSFTVEGTQLAFKNFPTQILIKTDFGISVAITDKNGNIDTNASGTVTISQHSGDGNVSSSEAATKTITSGMANWTAIQYNRPGKFSFKATSEGLLPDSVSLMALGDAATIVKPASETISVTNIKSTADTPGEAVEVLTFELKDNMENDLYSTFVTQINLKNAHPENEADWSNSIAGAIVKANGYHIITGEAYIKDDYMSIPVKNDALEIPSNSSVKVTVAIYLKTSKIEDNTQLQFYIDSSEHYFRADTSGSLFKETFPTKIYSELFTINVEATQLSFIETPNEPVGINSKFTVKVAATDENENIDKDANDIAIDLEIETGSDALFPKNTLTKNTTNGTAEWDNLVYQQADEFTILALNDSLKTGLSPKISAVDNNSTIEPAQIPIAAGDISISENFVNVFRFTVKDLGSKDKLPTIISEITLKNAQPENSLSLPQTISDLLIFTEKDTFPIKNCSIYNDEIKIEFDSSKIKIPDSSNITITVALKFYPNCKDGTKLQFVIEGEDHDFKTDKESSLLVEEFNYNITSSVHTIKIKPQKLTFASIPWFVTKNTDFDADIVISDSLGNIDIDSTYSLTIAGIPQNLTATTELTQTTTNGIGSFSGLNFSENTAFNLRISEEAQKFATDTSRTIQVVDSILTIKQNDFETDFNNWQNTNDWKLSAYNPINGSRSLRHNLSETDGTSYIVCPTTEKQLDGKFTQWQFQVKNSDWSPSSSNNFAVVLSADTSVLTANFSGYVAGVSYAGSQQKLSLWRVDEGNKELLIETDFIYTENTTAACRVVRDPVGVWVLEYDTDGNFDYFRTGGYAFDTTYQTLNNPGLVFEYTASRAGKLWLDDFSITASAATSGQIEVPAEKIPFNLETAKLYKQNAIVLKLSSEIDASFIKTDNFNLQINNNNLTISNVFFTASGKTIGLKTTETLSGTDTVFVQIKNLKALSGLKLNTSTFVVLPDLPQYGDVVINEIFFDPTPVIDLPEFEFIELFNNSNDTLNLKDWVILAGSSEETLPAYDFLPQSYLIVCDQEAAQNYNPFGQVLAVSGFPSLSNTESTISLFDAKGYLVANAGYSVSLHSNDYRKEGGWSLERIDPDNLSDENNWTSSNAKEGGTPGTENSKKDKNPDDKQPQLLRAGYVSDTQICLHLSETLDSISVLNRASYSIDGYSGTIVSIGAEAPDYKTIILTCSQAFDTTKTYTISILSDVSDWNENVINLDNNQTQFAIPQAIDSFDIIINELLFNPLPYGVDFVEFYNRSNKTLDLSELLLANRNDSMKISDPQHISDESLLLFPSDYLIITQDNQLTERDYYVENPEKIFKIKELPSLPDKEGTILLMHKNEQIIDEFTYSEAMHFELLNSKEGVSLERLEADAETNDKNNWHSAAENVGFATPTYKNSQYTPQTVVDKRIELSPEIFSPDNDGRDDVLKINYELDQAGWVMSIKIYDARGRLVRKLIENELLATEGFFAWDGINEENSKAPIGIYIIYIELFDLQGNVETFKKTCVLAAKLE